MDIRFGAVSAAFLYCALQVALPEAAVAADYKIGRSVDLFDGGHVDPGDTVTIEAGERGRLRLQNLTGTADKPIIVRNDSTARGPVVIRNPSAQRVPSLFNCNDCINVVIDGTRKWEGAPVGAYCGAPNGTTGCGIRVTSTAKGDAPTAYFVLSGLSSNFTVKGVELDGNFPGVATSGVGFRVGDEQIRGSRYPGRWREKIVLEKNYVHDIHAEGFYIGPNWNVDQLRLRNVKIRDNLVRNTGWEGIQLKSAIEGENDISGNVVIGGGAAKKDSSQGAHMGIQPYESVCDVFDNIVLGSGESGIGLSTQHLPGKFGPLNVRVYNNVVANAGVTGPLIGHGITVNSSGAGFAAKVYNNTVVDSEGHGINLDRDDLGRDQLVANNLITSSGDDAVSAPAGTDEYSNTVGSTGSAGFVAPNSSDYRITAGSVARDTGNAGAAPSDDLLGISRPQGDGPDRGAYEFKRD